MKSINSYPIFLFILSLTFCFQNLTAQNVEYKEEMDDPYMPMPAHLKSSSPAYFYEDSLIVVRQVNVDANGDNIENDAANEPSLAIDMTSLDRMVIGWRQFDNIQSNFRQAGIGYTEDAGESWNFLTPIESGIFRSDPVLATDKNGVFFYNSLSQDYSTDIFKTSNLEDWSDKTFAFGGDKQWMVIDNTDLPSSGNIYAFWKAQFSACGNQNFTRSLDNGATFEDCSLLQLNPTRGTLAIGPEGELYACGGWNGTHLVSKSISASSPQEVVAWEQETAVDLKGTQALYAGPNPSGMLGQVWVATDHSNTATHGNVYLLSSTDRNDVNDPADIMFSRSIDGGATWSEAITINDDNTIGNWQWFGTLSVAPNGRIDVVWLDTRDHPGTVLSNLYYAYSIDGGLSWSPNQKMGESFDPHLGWPNQEKMGDYFHMISVDEGAHLAWAATFNGEQDIFYSFIPSTPLFSSTNDLNNLSSHSLDLNVYPNPTAENFNVTVFSNKPQHVKIRITDFIGQTYYLSPSYFVNQGRKNIFIDMNEIGLEKSGLFLLTIENENQERVSEKIMINNKLD